jgi:hypothetical protein
VIKSVQWCDSSNQCIGGIPLSHIGAQYQVMAEPLVAASPRIEAHQVLPRAAAVSKGYNFASTWEQVRWSSAFPKSPLVCYRKPQDLVVPLVESLLGISRSAHCEKNAEKMLKKCTLALGNAAKLVKCSHLSFLQNAPLTDAQVATISLLAQASAERPLPAHVVRDRGTDRACAQGPMLASLFGLVRLSRG